MYPIPENDLSRICTAPRSLRSANSAELRPRLHLEMTMDAKPTNILDIPDDLPGDDEFFEVLASGDNVRIERIISYGHATPDGE